MWLKGAALILMLVAFPLISFGATREISWLWWAGLIALAIGGAMPVVLRYKQPDGP